MDPTLFHIDWDRLGEVLIVIIVISILLERALALVFEHRLFIKNLDEKGTKEFIAFALAFLVCVYWKFDAISMIILSERTSILGELITAGVLAGGSKGSVRLFRELMNIKSRVFVEFEEKKKAQRSSGPGTLAMP